MILGLHTATPTCGLFIFQGDAWTDESWEAGRTLAHYLLGRIDDAVVKNGGDSVKDIEGIVVFRGPGSYTGLRIGLTVANTLAESLAVPIVGVDGDDWRAEGLSRLQSGQNDQLVMPVYGGAPHITTPRK